MEEEDRVFNYTRAHSESAAKMGPSNIDGSTVNEESSLYCELPSSDKVAALWTDLLQHGSSSSSSGHSSILSISSITEMEQEECTGATGNITTSLVLNVESFGDEIDDGILQALEESCVEVYNKLNALNTRNCDPIFRVMESAQVEVIRDGLSPGSSILARRLGNSRTGRFLDDLYDHMNSTLAPSSSSVPTQSPSSSPTIRGPNLLSLVLSINGRCNGCPSDQRFFDEINVRRLEERSESSSHGSQVAATPRFLMELSGDLVEDCFCPVDYEELGGVTSASFFQSLDKKVSDSVGNQGFAFRLLDVKEETCLREDDFISYLTLEMQGDSSEVLGLEKDIEVIVQRTFNLNAETTCDPYGRAITSVQLLNLARRNLRGGRVFKDIDRELVDVENSTDTKLPTAASSLAPTMRGPHLFSLIFQVSGVCAGCAQEIDIFDEIKLRKRKLSSPSGECTCIDPSLKDGGQTADDFVVAFNKVAANSSIEALGVAIQARGSDSIDSEPPIPPSASPSSSPFSPPSTSIYPSDTPSNVPSVRPSSIPSGGPTFTPSASPTSCLHPTSCQEGKKVCARAANLCGGEGSCNGKNACRDSSGLQVGDSGCIGTSACQSATDLVVGDNSCLETCESLSGSIGSGSCIAPSTCSGTGATVQIGDNSCLETDSCAGLENARRSSLLTIGENSCQATKSCFEFSGKSIGDNSCNCEGCCSCEGLDQDIPADSCNTRGECCATPAPSAAPSAAPTYLCLDQNQNPVTSVDLTLNEASGATSASDTFGGRFPISFEIVSSSDAVNPVDFSGHPDCIEPPSSTPSDSRIVEVEEVDRLQYIKLTLPCGRECGQSFVVLVKEGCGATDSGGSCQAISFAFQQSRLPLSFSTGEGCAELTYSDNCRIIGGCDGVGGSACDAAPLQNFFAAGTPTDELAVTFPVSRYSAYTIDIYEILEETGACFCSDNEDDPNCRESFKCVDSLNYCEINCEETESCGASYFVRGDGTSCPCSDPYGESCQDPS